MLVHAKILKWGNSLALRLTGALKSIPQFEQGMNVEVEVTEKWIKVIPIRQNTSAKLPFSEAQLLADLTPDTAHADEIATLTTKEMGE